MKKHILPDEQGILWAVYASDELDPVWHALRPVREAGHRVPDLVLPDELPRFLQVSDPDWDSVVELWRSQGDSPAFRQAVSANTIREAITNAVHAAQPAGLGGTPVRAA